MRTGAIFARGSCRALKWMALFGVVFMLGVGQVAAQVKTAKITTVDEGGRLMVMVTPEISVPASNDGTTDLTVSVTPAFADPAQVDATKLQTVAEAPDITTTAVTLTWDVPANTSTTDPSSPSLPTKTATFAIGTDLDAEDERITVTVAVAGAGAYTNKGTADALAATTNAVQHITIDDADEQEFVWEVTTAKPKEGSPIAVTLMAKPTPDQLAYTTALSVTGMGYSVAPNSFSFDAAQDVAGEDGPMASLSITTPSSDKNRDMDTIMVNAFVAGTASTRVPALSIDVADVHALPMADKISAMAFMDDGKGMPSKDEAMSVMEGGDPVHVTVTVDRGTSGYPMGEDLKVSVMADGSQASDYRVDPAMVTIGSGMGEKKETFKLWALKDEDVGAEDLMLTLTAKGATADNGPGEVMTMFSIAIEDDTMPWVSVKDGAYDDIMMALGDDPLNPGDEVMIMTDDLFMYDDDMYNVSFGASVEGAAVSASSSGEAVTIMAMEAGEGKVTVTATATPMSGSLVITQDRANVAQVTFPVMVELADLMLTLSGPEDMNLVEGMSYEIKAMANRAVEMDTMVELVQTDGTASPSDYMVENITIMAGEMMGSTMLMVNADEMMENMDNMAEMLTLEGRSGAMKTNALSFYLWDAAVPALPIIAQLLLAAFLAIGGYRRYLRR